VSIISLMREDVLLESLDAGLDHVALLIGECSVVFMHAPGEIVTGVHKLLDFQSQGRFREARVHFVSISLRVVIYAGL
jgi:hypothetical protein